MSVIPVLFEDTRIPSFRPLSWTQPLYEIRCGLLNTRERVEICLARRDGETAGEIRGGLLSRRLLNELHTAPGWEADPLRVRDEVLTPGSRILFLNGRLAPRFDVLSRLVGGTEQVPDFAWLEGDRLLAALLPADRAQRMVDSWLSWEGTADGIGAWACPGIETENWLVPDLVSGRERHEVGTANEIWGGDDAIAAEVAGWIAGDAPVTLEWTWDVVSSTAAAIRGDRAALELVRGFRRWPFGLFAAEGAEPVWNAPMELTGGKVPAGCAIDDPTRLWLGPDVEMAPGTAIVTASGPVVIDRGVRIQPHAMLEGPLYLGPGSIVKAGARLYGESSFGVGCRIAGEIGESTFGDFANKQHDGFIGHAVLGSWINLGAMTTCSDLKNNYGSIRVDLGDGTVDTGRRFVGLMMGDHAKTAIGTLFNTGTCVGVASNIFGADMPPKHVGNFSWGGEEGAPLYDARRALETAEIVMGRRGCRLTAAHRDLLSALAG